MVKISVNSDLMAEQGQYLYLFSIIARTKGQRI